MSEQKLDLILTELQALKQDVQVIKQDQDAMKQDVQVMKQDHQDLTSQMNHRFDTLEIIVSGIQKNVEQLQTDVDGMATKEDLTYFDKKIGEHNREIFKMKNRA